MSILFLEIVLELFFNNVLWETRTILKNYFEVQQMSDKNINKPDIKTSVFSSINFHKLQVIFRLLLTLIYTNLSCECPNWDVCNHDQNLNIKKQYKIALE